MGDAQDAFEAVVAARTPALLRTAFLLTGGTESARDLLQNALERVSRRLGSIRDPQAMEAYIRATMATSAANERRRFWHRELAIGSLPDSPAEPMAGSDVRLDLLRALQALPADQRVVLVLRFYEDLSEAATAQRLGIALGTVKSRTARALQTLRVSGVLVEST